MPRRPALLPVLVAMALALAATPAWGADVDNPDSFIPTADVDRPETIGLGDSGRWVYELQNRLADAGFRPGAADGRFGQETLGAVYAFQKVHDLPRDGIFDFEYWRLLDVEVSLPKAVVDPDRVEVDLENQVLYLVEDHNVGAIVPISSANGGTYTGRGGTQVRARTPEGAFKFDRRIRGWRESYLGWLYHPFYFYGGYAIHGSKSVPPYPASHGCVRVEIHDMDYLRNQVALGMPVYIYGNRVDREDLLPTRAPTPKQIPIYPGHLSSAGSAPSVS